MDFVWFWGAKHPIPCCFFLGLSPSSLNQVADPKKDLRYCTETSCKKGRWNFFLGRLWVSLKVSSEASLKLPSKTWKTLQALFKNLRFTFSVKSSAADSEHTPHPFFSHLSQSSCVKRRLGHSSSATYGLHSPITMLQTQTLRALARTP